MEYELLPKYFVRHSDVNLTLIQFISVTLYLTDRKCTLSHSVQRKHQLHWVRNCKRERLKCRRARGISPDGRYQGGWSVWRGLVCPALRFIDSSLIRQMVAAASWYIDGQLVDFLSPCLLFFLHFLWFSVLDVWDHHKVATFNASIFIFC